MRITPIRRVPLLTVLLSLMPLVPLVGQVEVVAIVRGMTAIDSTDQVIRTAAGSAQGRPLTLGMTLGVDDEVRSRVDSITVELRCAAGSRVILSGAFRIQVEPADAGIDCAYRH